VCVLKKINYISFIYLKTYIDQNPQFLWAATVAATVAATGWPLGGHWVATAGHALPILNVTESNTWFLKA